jgi:hypothetical protein
LIKHSGRRANRPEQACGERELSWPPGLTPAGWERTGYGGGTTGDLEPFEDVFDVLADGVFR